MYRISRNGQEPIIEVDTVEQIKPAISSLPNGRYHVQKISADSAPSGHAARRWGLAIIRANGSVVLKPDPAPTMSLVDHQGIWGMDFCGLMLFSPVFSMKGRT